MAVGRPCRLRALVSLTAASTVVAGVLASAAHAAPGTITTVAGDGTAGYAGDGGPATSAKLNEPAAVAALANGGFVILDRNNCLVREVSRRGRISTVAGETAGAGSGLNCGYGGDGGPATAAHLSQNASALSPLPGGGFLIADGSNCVIRKVNATGKIATVAGTPPTSGPTYHCGYAGDGGDATAAEIDYDGFSEGVSALPGGGFLIADGANCVIRKVNATGKIATVAGTPPTAGPTYHCGTTGDGGPATAAELAIPTGVAAVPGGGYLIPDFSGACLVRAVSASGRIRTAAGTGTCGYGGDGGPATSAMLGQDLASAAPLPGGGFLLADPVNCLIRKVSAGGRITTVAGRHPTAGPTYHCGSSGDGGPATKAKLNFPFSVSVTSDGGYLIADEANAKVRRVQGFPPRAKLAKHPNRSIHTRRGRIAVTFGFRSTEALSSFDCRLDGGRYRRCRSPQRYRVGHGKHTFRVRATNQYGVTGKASVFRFNVGG